MGTSKAIADIAAERQRQIADKGWTAEHDDSHSGGEMALAAACYASPINLYKRDNFANGLMFGDPWPWAMMWDKRQHNGNQVLDNQTAPPSVRRRHLVKAAALIVAEIERMDRAEDK